MFFNFFILGIWWNWNRVEFKALVKNSVSVPIFVLCYSPYCPHCHGLPEGLSEYNKTLAANRTDFLITTVDCYNTGDCGIFGIRGTPHMVLVLGSNRRYWPVSPERGPEGWDRWINAHIKPNVRPVCNEEELEVAKREPKGGGATFVLEVPNENHSLLTKIQKTAKRFSVYNDSFVYTINKSIENPVMHSYYSPYCSRSYVGSWKGIERFVNDNRFGVFHNYDYSEFQQLKKSKRPAVLLLTDRELSEIQLNSLAEVTREHCSDVVFGWSDDEKVIESLHLKGVFLPVMYGLNKPPGTNKMYKGRIRDIWKTDFMNSYEEHSFFMNIIGCSPRNEFIFKLVLFLCSVFVICTVTIKTDNTRSKTE